jgi:hypothetical protein
MYQIYFEIHAACNHIKSAIELLGDAELPNFLEVMVKKVY